MDEEPLTFEDDFDGAELDLGVWFPHYLPAWQSRATTAATYAIRDSCLELTIPPEQGPWGDGTNRPPIRISGIQSGNASGPLASPNGQHRYRTDLVVREEQEPFWGWTPGPMRIEVRARCVLTPSSMAAFWMIGLEDVPERSAEILVAEIFGNAVEVGVSAEVGMGLRQFRDPHVTDDVEAVRLPIDVAEFHTYAVDWTSERADFLVDGTVVRSCPNPPTYPVQVMLTVFDFRERSTPGDGAIPAFIVDWVRGFAHRDAT
jgi:hypothetical protein